MALAMYLGLPRNGKSYGALKYAIQRELVYGKRPVVTNLAINFAALNAYLQEKYPAAKVNLDARLRILSDSELKNYWMVRGPDYLGKKGVIPASAMTPDGLIDFGQFASDEYMGTEGVLYILDEVHIHFDSRKTMKASPQMAFYNSQHGKLNDDVIGITQFAKLVDVRFKDFAQSWHYFTYGTHRRFLTVFRGIPMFTEKVYCGEVKGVTDTADEVYRYRLDPAIAACYDTSQGVGITGRNRPEDKRKGGISIFWGAIPICALIAALAYGPDFITRQLAGAVKGATTFASEKTAEVVSVSPSPLPRPSAQPDITVTRDVRVPGTVPSDLEHYSGADRVTVTSYAVSGGRVNVTLSDGRVYTEADAELGALYRNSVIIGGRKYFLVPGAGAKRAPVRQDTGVPAVVPSDVPTAMQSGANKRPVAAAASVQHSAPPHQSNSGAWSYGDDGVYRLVNGGKF